MSSSTPYTTLEQRFKRLADLGGAAAVLNWDQAAIMPKGGNAARGEQLAALGGVVHEMLVSTETLDLIEAARAAPLDDWQAANLALIERRYIRATALPQDLVEARARATNACEMAWRQARADNDFQGLRPHLEEVLRLTREAAVLEGRRLGLEPYAALLDQFQPGLDETTIDVLFEPLETRLPGMIDDALARQAAPLVPQGPFPVAGQKALAQQLMGQIGFDLNHGRLDVSLPSVLRRHARRRSHHHPLRRNRFHLRAHGGAARDRPRPLRTAACPRGGAASRWVSPGHGRPRKPIPAHRDAGLPVVGVSPVFSPRRS